MREQSFVAPCPLQMASGEKITVLSSCLQSWLLLNSSSFVIPFLSLQMTIVCIFHDWEIVAKIIVAEHWQYEKPQHTQ
jgi:hypothetical protein